MDARIVKTKDALRKTLIEYMMKMSVREIPIATLCKQAGIARSTFYLHYKDIDEAVEELAREQLDKYREFLHTKEKMGGDLINPILNSLAHAKKLYRTEAGGMVSERFKNEVISITKEFGYNEWRKMLRGVDERIAELAYEGLLAGALQVGLAMKDNDDRENVVRTITSMVDS